MRKRRKKPGPAVVVDEIEDAGKGVEWDVSPRHETDQLRALAGVVREFLQGTRPPQNALSEMSRIVNQLDP